MENQLYEKFIKVGLNDKRNIFNQEMAKIYELLNQVTNAVCFEKDATKIINYDVTNDSKISEDEYLFYQYQNLINIRKLIINYLSQKI